MPPRAGTSTAKAHDASVHLPTHDVGFVSGVSRKQGVEERDPRVSLGMTWAMLDPSPTGTLKRPKSGETGVALEERDEERRESQDDEEERGHPDQRSSRPGGGLESGHARILRTRCKKKEPVPEGTGSRCLPKIEGSRTAERRQPCLEVALTDRRRRRREHACSHLESLRLVLSPQINGPPPSPPGAIRRKYVQGAPMRDGRRIFSPTG